MIAPPGSALHELQWRLRNPKTSLTDEDIKAGKHLTAQYRNVPTVYTAPGYEHLNPQRRGVPTAVVAEDKSGEGYVETTVHEGRHHTTRDLNPAIYRRLQALLPPKGVVGPSGGGDYRHWMSSPNELTQGFSQISGHFYNLMGHRPSQQETRDLLDPDKPLDKAWQIRGRGIFERQQKGEVPRGEAPRVIDAMRTWIKALRDQGRHKEAEELLDTSSFIMPAVVQNKKRFFPEQGGEQMA